MCVCVRSPFTALSLSLCVLSPDWLPLLWRIFPGFWMRISTNSPSLTWLVMCMFAQLTSFLFFSSSHSSISFNTRPSRLFRHPHTQTHTHRLHSQFRSICVSLTHIDAWLSLVFCLVFSSVVNVWGLGVVSCVVCHPCVYYVFVMCFYHFSIKYFSFLEWIWNKYSVISLLQEKLWCNSLLED